MKDKHNSNGKIIKFLNGKAFYVVLCICFLGIGIAIWSGVEGMKSKVEPNTTISQNNTTEENLQEDTAQNPQTDDKTPTESSKPSSEQQTASKPTEQASTGVAGFFIKPMLGDIMKGFSDTELQYSETYLDMRLHKAIDIKGQQGDPVCAAGDGVVKSVLNDPLLGTVVTVDHGNGIVVKYCGLAKNPPVKKGDTVDSSVRIGVLGDIPSESVEPYHLHLEFYKNGKAVDPLTFLE